MWKNRILALLLLSSCVTADAVDPAEPAGMDESSSTPANGTTGTVTVRTSHGLERMKYVVDEGRMIVQGDIDLGPVSRLRGGAVNADERWPSSTIHYRLGDNFVGQTCDADTGVCTDVRDWLRDILDDLSDQLPIDFVEDTAETATNYLKYRFDPGMTAAGASSEFGFVGGEELIRIQPQSELDATTIRHETMHALGMWHEQARNDRGQFVVINDGCIDKIDQYDQESDSRDTGPYDYNSILHYKDTSSCLKNPVTDACYCKTMTPKVAGAIIRDPDAPRFNGLSPEDVNTLFRMYAKELGIEEANDKMGSALAIGDFDGDGYDDLAVGLPGENREIGSTTIANAGAVMIYKGTSNGPVAWQLLWESDYTFGSGTANAAFGSALAVGDFDADGRKDLAVGAPGNGGYVMVYFGSKSKGLEARRQIMQSNFGLTDENGDKFGAALAAGRITGLKRNDNMCDDKPDNDIVNQPYDTLVIGAPGDRTASTTPGAVGYQVRAGTAYVVQLVAVACTNDHKTTPAAPTVLASSAANANGDNFGAAIAVGDLDADGKSDIAIGAPDRNSHAGFVATFKGKKPPESSPLLWSAMATSTGSPIYGPAGARLGTSLAIGDVFSGGGTELVIGAPGSNVVWVRNGGVSAPNGVWTLQPATSTAGDQFGFSLAIGDVDGISGTDVIVGAPGSNGGAGTIAVFRGGGTTWWRTTVTQNDSLPDFNEPNDQFGFAIAVGHLDGDGNKPSTASPATRLLDVAIGVPGERSGFPWSSILQGPVGSGAVSLLRGQAGAMPYSWKDIDQIFSGRLD